MITITSRRLQGALILSVAGILLLTGLFKLVAVINGQDYMELSNPIFDFLKNKHILAVSAVCELGAAAYLFCTHDTVKRASIVMWLVFLSCSYKMGLGLIKYEGPCGCLAGFNSLLHLTKRVERNISDSLLLYMLAVGCGLLAWEFARKRGILQRILRR